MADNYDFNEIWGRLEEFIEKQGVSKRQLCLKLGVSTSFFTKPRDISVSVIVALHKCYNLSYRWILGGKGEMFVEDKEGIGTNRTFSKSFVEALFKIIELQNEQMKNFFACNEEACRENGELTIKLLELLMLQNVQLKQSLQKGTEADNSDFSLLNEFISIIKNQNEQIRVLNEEKKALKIENH